MTKSEMNAMECNASCLAVVKTRRRKSIDAPANTLSKQNKGRNFRRIQHLNKGKSERRHLPERQLF